MNTEAFRGLVDKETTGCWLWQGGADHGYGVVGWEGRRWSTHRLAYTLMWGGIPDGLQLDHLCRNTLCVYPWHLEPVTAAENNWRKVIHQRAYRKRCGPRHRRFPGREGRRCLADLWLHDAAWCLRQPAGQPVTEMVSERFGEVTKG